MGSSPIRVATFLYQSLPARTEEVVNDSPVDCQSRRRPRRAVRVATEPHPSRHFYYNTCGFSSFGRAPPCQGGGGGFEPRNPLQNKRTLLVGVLLFWTGMGLSSHQSDDQPLSLPCKLNVLLRTKAKQRSVIPLSRTLLVGVLLFWTGTGLSSHRSDD